MTNDFVHGNTFQINRMWGQSHDGKKIDFVTSTEWVKIDCRVMLVPL